MAQTLFELVIAIYALQMVCTISSPNKEFDRHVPIECFCNVITQIPQKITEVYLYGQKYGGCDEVLTFGRDFKYLRNCFDVQFTLFSECVKIQLLYIHSMFLFISKLSLLCSRVNFN